MGSFEHEIRKLWHLGLTGAGVAIGHLDSGVDSCHCVFSESRINCAHFGYRLGDRRVDIGIDSAGHGTHTAALIVGGSCDGRRVGIAPQAVLHTGTVIEAGNIVARILAGLDWLLDSDVNIVCLSLGVFDGSPIFHSLILKLIERDAVVVCPAGNRGAGMLSVPGSYPECLTVGACDEVGYAIAFSGSSPNWQTLERPKPDVLAPGVDVVSASANGTLCTKNGTSQACAIVAGIVTLLREAFPEATADEVVSAIRDSARGACADQAHRSACGMVEPMSAYTMMTTRLRSRTQSESNVAVSATSARHNPYVGERLRTWLTSNSLTDAIEVVVEFSSFDTRDSFVRQVRHEAERYDKIADVRELRHCPIVFGRFSRKRIEEVIANPGLRNITTADVDRLK